MALKIPWKSLSKSGAFSSKLGAFSSKRVAFFAAVGLFLVVGLVLRSGYFGQPEVEQKAPVTEAAPAPSTAATPAVQPAESIPKPQLPAQETATPEPQPPAPETATAPNQQVEQTGEAVDQAEPFGETVEQTEEPELPDPGMVLVSRRSVEVLSGPSSSAVVMYGFPAGRSFRVIGREGSFTQIQDVESGAKGWIDEAALAPPPRMPDVSAPSRSKPDAVSRTRATGSADPKPKAVKKGSQAVTDSEAAAEPVETRKRPGLFGGDGPFRGIFGGGN